MPHKLDSLADGFRHRRTTAENEAFVRTLLQGIDVDEFYACSGYIKVTRKSGKRPLRIYYGYTNGFHSMDEINSPDAPKWKSGRAKGTFGVNHPDHGTPRNGTRKK